MSKALFIFRRDLRLDDNTALNVALKEHEVLPIFILDPRQLEKHAYRSLPGLQFMIESLEDLKDQLASKDAKLYLFKGISDEVIKKLITSQAINAVYLNKDYTPFAIARDKKIEALCKKEKISFNAFEDALLTNPNEVLTDTNTPYQVFTSFFKKASLKEVPLPKTQKGKFLTPKIHSEDLPKIKRLDLVAKGGSKTAKSILKNIKKFEHYNEDRNIPSKDATTHLSPHLKFGTISIREAYHAVKKEFGKHHTLIREFYFRDFFTYVPFHNPHVFGHAFQKKYEHLHWEDKHFKEWCEGKTGFPIVDAGMRELNQTGFMHNRVRMIVASFLVKDLHIDWRKGEKYFATKLTDYDPCVNNSNWQWAASTGCDAQPYFRIFNPWTQQIKFDPQAIYIKRWVPELENVEPSIIHDEKKQKGSYPMPIVDHKEEAKKAIAYFKK